MIFDVSHPEVREAVLRAIQEDLGSGDLTSELCVPPGARATGCMIARQEMTLAGVELLLPIFDHLAPGLCQVTLHHASGARLRDGDHIATVRGPARNLLAAERTALNFVQRLSGIATLAAAFVKAVEGTGCRVLDTRKTTPGLRRLEKMAVAAGGACNHRAGLYDAVLIKNNHVAASGGVRQALERTRNAGVPVEIEVRTRAELEQALEAGARHLLLDNLTPRQAREWIAFIDGRATVELSGGIVLANARAYAETGAQFISSGAITQSAPAANINFRLELAG
jgi:nicotinate-nucleotide pyrophosphorylase (carboxylating)